MQQLKMVAAQRQEEAEVVAVQEESKSSSNNVRHNLHVVFIPLLAHGHQIPLFDIARLFAAQEGVIATFVTTPGNASVFNKDDRKPPPDIIVNIEVIPFPGEEFGLPPGFENFENVDGDDTVLTKFFKAICLLQDPFEAVIARIKPNFLISDMFLPWTLDVATKFGIPRLVFHGSSFFAMSASEVVKRENPFKQHLREDDEEYVEIPGLPDRIALLKSQTMPESLKADWDKNPHGKLIMDSFEAEKKSYGVVMNSFYELESKYADYYRSVLGKRAWAIGPVSLRNRTIADKASRGKKAAINQHDCLKWLDSKPSNSVIYVSFGSIVAMCHAQLRQIATALEASEQNFIWTVRRKTDQEQRQQQQEEADYWLPDPDFEERNREKGLIIRGWAPQVLILDHESTGGFMTHCGWNSTLEGIAAGVPMVTWPIFAEQFLNEKLLTQIVKTGIPVGSKKYCNQVVSEVTVGSEAIQKAIRRLMVGNEADDIRRKAHELKQLAYRALDNGGSSYQGLSDLLSEMNSFSATIN